MSVDFDSLLEKARHGAPRSEFTPYMAALSDPSGFKDNTRLRILGNAIANSPENAAILASNSKAIDALLRTSSLGLQILYNGTVANPEFAVKVLESPAVYDLEPSEAAQSLLGSIWDVCPEKVPHDLVVCLALNGFLELIIQSPKLETDPTILDNFAKVYNNCQKCSLGLDDEEEDMNTLGVRVVGNISSHKSFGLDVVRETAKSSSNFTWETVALLGNLTAELANLPEVMKLWPNLVEDTVKLIKSEDPSYDIGGFNAFEDEGQKQADAENAEEEEHELEDPNHDEEEVPFDLELWGPLLRNVARNEDAAQQIALHSPEQLYHRLVAHPATNRIGYDFCTAIAQNVYDQKLAFKVTEEPYNDISVILSSAICEGLMFSKLASGDVLMAARLVQAVCNGLHSGSTEVAMVKGTKTLAMISEKYPNLRIDIEDLKAKIPANSPARQNLAQIKPRE